MSFRSTDGDWKATGLRHPAWQNLAGRGCNRSDGVGHVISGWNATSLPMHRSGSSGVTILQRKCTTDLAPLRRRRPERDRFWSFQGCLDSRSFKRSKFGKLFAIRRSVSSRASQTALSQKFDRVVKRCPLRTESEYPSIFIGGFCQRWR